MTSRTAVDIAAMKADSEVLAIALENYIPAFVAEEFLLALSGIEKAENFWLKNPKHYSMDDYRRKPVSELAFFYCGSGMDELKSQFEQVCEVSSQIFSYTMTEQKHGCIVAVTAEIEQMQVPLQVKLEWLKEEKQEPEHVTLHLCIHENKAVSFPAYPPEYEAADAIFTILEKLELINDMSSYHDVYTILKREALDGRKLEHRLLEKCGSAGIPVIKKRMELLRGYQSYAYMKKKWQLYLKRENKKAPGWQELMELLLRFLDPIWNMMCEDLIFIGDWMPELERFLE